MRRERKDTEMSVIRAEITSKQPSFYPRLDGPAYGTVLPGFLMPWMFLVPEGWLPKNLMQIPLHEQYDAFGTEPDARGETFWTVCRSLIAANREPPLPPPSADFKLRRLYERRASGGTRT